MNLFDCLIILLIIIYPFLPLIKERSGMAGNLLELLLIIMLLGELIIKNKVDKYIVLTSLFLMFFLIEGIVNEQYAFSGFRIFLFYIFLMFYLLKVNKVQLYRIATACIFAGVIMACGALLQFVYPDAISAVHAPDIWIDLRLKTDFTAFSIYNRAISFMTDPNILSVYLTFIFCVGNELLDIGIKKRMFQVVMIASICTTQSRTGLFLIILYLLLVFTKNFFTKRSIKPITLIIVSLFLGGGIYYIISHWSMLVTFLRIDTILSGNGRAGNNIVNIKYIFDNNIWSILFGVGLGNGQTYIFENSYYLLLYIFGVLGSGLLVLLIYKMLKSIWIRQNIILGMVYLVACLVGDYILIPHVTYVLLIGLVVSSIKYGNESKGGIQNNESCTSY